MPCSWGATCHRLPWSSSSASGSLTDPHMKALRRLFCSQRCCHSMQQRTGFQHATGFQGSQPTTAHTAEACVLQQQQSLQDHQQSVLHSSQDMSAAAGRTRKGSHTSRWLL